MKGPSVLAIPIALLFTIIVTNVPQSDALSPQETCPLTKNGSYIGDQTSCQKWHLCVDGQITQSGSCGPGLRYSVPDGVCDYASNVQCNTNATTMCDGLTNVYKPDPNSCQNYCYCQNGVTECAACPKGMYFDPKTTACVWQTDSTCIPNSSCSLSQNGFVKGDGCTSWVRCFNGQQADSGNCQNGLRYNPLTASCDYAANVQCSSSGPPSPAKPVVNAPTATASTCKTATAGSFVTGVTTATDSCRGYFVCKNATDANAVYGLCPENSSFNPTAQKCTDPNQVACLGNRCDGVNRKWMAVPNSGCKQYTPCSNGIPGAVMSCNSQYPYYNEEDQACQETQPNFPICTATAPAI